MFFNNRQTLKVNRVAINATLPSKAHTGYFEDAAFDLFPFIPSLLVDSDDNVISLDTFTLLPGERKVIGTGIRVAIPDGYWLKFHERSGLAAKSGIQVLAGVIDSGWTGELKVVLFNSHESFSYTHDCSKAIAQFTMEKLTKTDLKLISDDDMMYETSKRTRKENGFGSSDVKK